MRGDDVGRRPREHSEHPSSAACYAAHSALYFRPDGLVHACCATGFAVGSVVGRERQSLREIWNGAALRLPANLRGRRFLDLLTGRPIGPAGRDGQMPLADVLRDFPVALCVNE